jgi:hypothetical protein
MADPLTLMLKEHNAKAFSHLHTARSNILNDMFKFTDKLMAHLSQRCVCCQARGFTDCPLVPTEGESGQFFFHSEHIYFCQCSHSHRQSIFFPARQLICFIPFMSAPPADSLRTPVNQKLSGVRLDLSDAEGTSDFF